MASESVGVTVSALDRFSAPIGGMTTALTKFGTSAAGVTTILGVGLVMAIKSATSTAAVFQNQMATVSTMLDSRTIPMMDDFRQEILDMSADFGEGTQALTDGLYDILSASIPAEKAMKVLEVSVKAAKGGMTDAGTAADAITTVLNSYQLQAEDSAYVSDILFNIVKRGKLRFEDLASSIGKVAALSAASGLSLEALGANITTLTRAGLETHQAMTAIKGILSAFLDPTDDAKDAAKLLGFELNTASLQGEGLIEVFKKIADSEMEVVAKAFPNIRALTGVAIASQQLTGFTQDLTVEMEKGGEAQAAYEKKTDTLAHAQDKLGASWDRLKVTIGTEFLPITKSATEHLTEHVDAADANISAIGRFREKLGQLSSGELVDVIMGFRSLDDIILDHTKREETLGGTILLVTDAVGSYVYQLSLAGGETTKVSSATEDVNTWLEKEKKLLEENAKALETLTEKYGKYAGVMGAFRTREGIRLGIEMEPGAVRLPSGGTIVDPERFKEWEEQVKEKRGPEAEFKETIADDFVQRPGQPAVKFNPEDTIIGVKGGGGGTGGETVIRNVIILDGREIYNSVNRHTMNEMI